MNISKLFIQRPVMTTLVMLVISFFGALCYRALPVSELPNVAYPVIEVTVSYPGASPQTMADSVTTPLERQFMTISGVQLISSVSVLGGSTIVIQFSIEKNIDFAATDVQAAITAALPELPSNLPHAPTYTKVNPAASPVLFFALSSPTLPIYDLYNLGNTLIGKRLSMISGVAQVSTYGSPFAVRLRVDPRQVAARGLGIDQVADAIQKANVLLPTGNLYGQTTEYTLNVTGQMYTAEAFGEVAVKTQNGSIVRFKEIGTAINSVQNDKMYHTLFSRQGQEQMVGLAILKQPTSNTLQIIRDINRELKELIREIPGGVHLVRVYDQSVYIDESVREVKLTLLIAILLVVTVVFFYLGKARNTLIPAISIPMSILGTCIVMYYSGYTIDILSLLAITLSIGFLVDDAIVVVENVARHAEQGKPPMLAAMDGTQQISLTILSMTLSLASVFIPLVFMAGLVGKILHEFAVTLMTVVLFSGFISLSLTPLLCSRLISSYGQQTHTAMERLAQRLNGAMLRLYRPGLLWSLQHRVIVMVGGALCIVASLLLYHFLPKSFMPNEDIDLIEGFTRTEDGTSPYLVAKYQQSLGQVICESPYVENLVVIGGYPQDNEGMMFIHLKKNRSISLTKVMEELYARSASVVGPKLFLKPLPLINLEVAARPAPAMYQYALKGVHSEALFAYARILEERLKQTPGFEKVSSNMHLDQPTVYMEILRDKASLRNVSVQNIENVLSLAYANADLTPINETQNIFYGIMETLPKFYHDPSKLDQLWLSSSTGNMVPLAELVTVHQATGPLSIDHIDGLPSVTLSFNLKGIEIAEAIATIEDLAKQVLPSGITGHLQGTASVFKASIQSINFLLPISIFIIYVILGILYERFLPPLTVMSTLPPATMGGLLSLWLTRQPLSLPAILGLLLLMGIVLKNGIIMIDFANEMRHKEGKSALEAIEYACTVRFRPIIMTTLAALAGALPVAVSIGGSLAEGRKPLGIVVVGGLIVSQLLTLYLTPVTYVYMEKLREVLLRKFKGGDESGQTPSVGGDS